MRPVTLRISEETQTEVEYLARREGRAPATLLRDLVEEGVRMRKVPGVTFVGRPPLRRAAVAGTGLDVWQLVQLYRSYAEDAERLLEDFPHLQRRHVETALAYRRAYPEEIEELIRYSERPIDELMREFPFIRPG